MAMETSVLLRSLLFQALKTDNIEEVRDAISVMCTKDDIAAVKEQLNSAKAREESKRNS